MSELLDKQVNAQKESLKNNYFQSYKKCAMKIKQSNKKKKKTMRA